MEAMCLMVQMRREVAEYQKIQALAVAIRSIMPVGENIEGADTDGKSVREALNSLQGSLMPFVKNEIKKEEGEILKALESETKRGPLRVQALSNPTVKSRIRERAIQELKKPPVRPTWQRRRR